MDFTLTEQERVFKDEWREYLESNLPDTWIAGGRHEHWPDDEVEQFECKRAWHRQLYEDGWAGPHWPEEYGGLDLSPIEAMVYEHERIRADAPEHPGNTLVGRTLIQIGDEWQRERFLPKILSAEELWCQGYSEPDHGSDIAGLECEAEKNGDEFVINGEKIWTSRSHYADYCFLMTRTDSSGTKHEGITALIVEMDQPGVEMKRLHQINDEQMFSQVYFDDAVAPEKHVVGEVNEGWDVIRTLSSFEQSWTRAFEAERRFNEILAYCQHNERGGEKLATKPTTRRELAKLDLEIQATKLTRYRQISRRFDDPIPGPEGSLDVVQGDELAIDVEEFGIDMIGPESALWEDGLDDGRRIRDWLLWIGLWIGGGTGDIQRNIIGEQVLGLPRDIKSDYSHLSPDQQTDVPHSEK